MAERAAPWYRMLWDWVDGLLRSLSDSLQRVVRTLRLLRALLVVGILLVLASPVVLFLAPRWFPVAYAVAVTVLAIPLVALLFLVALPLRARSVVRLIDQGYPANAREVAIRIAARKMRDQSIETEELLVETAVNESRKAIERLRRLKQRLDEADRPAPPPDAAGKQGP